MLDQKVNARRVAELGAGLQLDADRLHPGLLRWAVRRLTTDPSVRHAVAALRDRIAGADRLDAAVTALQQAANGSCRSGHPPR